VVFHRLAGIARRNVASPGYREVFQVFRNGPGRAGEIMARAKSGTRAANTIAFQGEPGANSDMACHAAFPYMTTLPCPTFEAAMAAGPGGTGAPGVMPGV